MDAMEPTSIDTSLAAALNERIEGAVIAPGDDGYDAARAIWNGMIDRRPALIARVLTSADVAAAILFAREHGLALTVRGGGHNVAGGAVADDALVVDLSEMREVTVDPERRIVRVQGGATWGDV